MGNNISSRYRIDVKLQRVIDSVDEIREISTPVSTHQRKIRELFSGDFSPRCVVCGRKDVVSMQTWSIGHRFDIYSALHTFLPGKIGLLVCCRTVLNSAVACNYTVRRFENTNRRQPPISEYGEGEGISRISVLQPEGGVTD